LVLVPEIKVTLAELKELTEVRVISTPLAEFISVTSVLV
jgi:hypothetical protein